jgi:hypothetical protein
MNFQNDKTNPINDVLNNFDEIQQPFDIEKEVLTKEFLEPYYLDNKPYQRVVTVKLSILNN